MQDFSDNSCSVVTTAAESKEGSFLFWECAEYTEVCIRTSGLAEVCIFEFYTLFTPDLTLVIHL